MGETKQLAVLVAACLLMGIIGLAIVMVLPPLFEGNLVVDSYTATLHENGAFTEQYTYNVRTSGEYRMLYRAWQAPLVQNTSSSPNVAIVSINPPAGATGYGKDENGAVILFGESSSPTLKKAIQNLAEINEAGVFNPDYFSQGTYTVSSAYVIHPPIEYDATSSHLNLKLAGSSHIPYKNVRITIPVQETDRVYVYPPTLSVERTGDSAIITGGAAADENLAVEILSSPNGFSQMPGFRTPGNDIAGKTGSANFWYNLPYYAGIILNILGKIAVILIPFLLLVIYYRYGREKKFTVPAYLSTVPNPSLRPWQVNLLFKGDALDFDKDGYYATLLDLHRKKNISIIEKEGGKALEIRILSGDNLDPYEQRVFAFISQVSEKGVLDTSTIEALAEQARTNSAAEEKALQYQKMLTDVTGRLESSLPGQYIVDGRDHLVPLLLSVIVLFAINLILAITVMPMCSYILFPGGNSLANRCSPGQPSRLCRPVDPLRALER